MPFTSMTRFVHPAPSEQTWWVVDARDLILGRLACDVARTLMGKHRPDYTPHSNQHDHVIVLNAEKIRLTGKRADQKVYYRHSGYMGGLKTIPFSRMMAEKPDEVIRIAVRRMLPKNRLAARLITNLKVYRGPEHPHQAQQPKPLIHFQNAAAK